MQTDIISSLSSRQGVDKQLQLPFVHNIQRQQNKVFIYLSPHKVNDLSEVHYRPPFVRRAIVCLEKMPFINVLDSATPDLLLSPVKDSRASIEITRIKCAVLFCKYK